MRRKFISESHEENSNAHNRVGIQNYLVDLY
jgi:hypothetical protein